MHWRGGASVLRKRTKTSRRNAMLSLFTGLFTPAFIAVITLQCASRYFKGPRHTTKFSSAAPSPLLSSLRPLKECCNFLNCFYESTRCSFLPSAPLAYFPLPPAAALHNSNTACQSISHLACSETKVSLALLLTLSQQLTLQHGCEKEERGNRRRRGPTFARVVNLSVGGYLFCALLIQIRSNLRRS